MSETPTSKGMGPDEPVGSTRSGFRSRYIVILGGLAVVLVAGVILAGVIPTGDRAGSTASNPSPSASATVEETASESASPTVSEEQSADATTDASSTDASPTPSASATVEVTTCADGGECQVGDLGPGGGTIIYVKAEGFTCGESREDECTTLEAGAVTYGQLCSISKPYLLAWSPGMSQGAWLGDKSKDSCQGGLLSSVRASTEGGKSDWFVGSKVEVSKAVEQEVLLGVDGLDLWTVDQGRYTNTANIWYGITDLWQDYFGTTGFAYVIPMRTF